MVKENRSVFPFKARYRMVKEGVSDLRNVIVHPGSEYILSSVTFPSYFIKEAGEKSAWQAGLDIKVFQKYICPALDIRVRFVGEEPFDLATKAYNEKMKEILLPEGIEVREIKRLETAGEAVSASRVRKLLSENKSIDHLVPDSSKRYLETEDGKMIIGRLRENGN